MKKMSTKQLCLMGLFTAIVAILTFVKLPIPMQTGYPNLGDSGIILAGLALGGIAALPAALGSAVADLFYGYAVYAPFTFVIKGAMGYFAGKYLTGGMKIKNIFIVIAVSLFMVASYFLTDMILYGWAAAVGSVLGNITQAGATVALSFAILALPVKKL